MKTTIRNHRSSVALVLGAVAALALSGCSGEAPVLESEDVAGVEEPGTKVSNNGGVSDNGDEVIQLEDALGKEMLTAFDPAKKILTIDFDEVVGEADGETPATAVTVAVGNGLLLVNGYPLSHPLTAVLNAPKVKLKPADVKAILIKTLAANDKVILDSLGGAIGSSGLTYTGSTVTAGIVVDFGANAGQLSLRATAGNDNWKATESADSVFFETTGDKKLDVQVTGAGALLAGSVYTVAMADGNDTFTASAFGPLAGGVTGITAAVDGVAGSSGATAGSLKPLTVKVNVYGGAGADTITGGMGNDKLFGGADADVFKAASNAELAAATGTPVNDGDDLISGGAGIDKVDYSGRTGAVQAVLDGDISDPDPLEWTHTKSGLLGPDTDDEDEDEDVTELTINLEDDTLVNDLEDITGGSGDDVLTGNALPNKIFGGAGKDTLSGGAIGSCVTPAANAVNPTPRDTDALDGGDGDDTFAMGTASDCGMTITGGAGIDTVDYSLRTADIQITLDAKATSGAVANATIATPVHAPASTGGTFSTIKTDIEKAIGSKANANRIIGSAANDTLIGGDLVDYIDGLAGNDTIKGGPGADKLFGGAGDDNLYGEAGDDVILGGAGNDTFYGGADADTLSGEDGDDVFVEGEEPSGDMDDNSTPLDDTDDFPINPIQHGTGSDIINGGAGYNQITYAGRTTGLTAVMCNDAATKVGAPTSGAVCPAAAVSPDAGAAAEDRLINVQHLVGSEGDDELVGTTVVDLIEGGAGADKIWGGAGPDQLYGDDGIDTIKGEAGDDSIDGGDGADVLDGGDGDDICSPEVSLTSCEL